MGSSDEEVDITEAIKTSLNYFLKRLFGTNGKKQQLTKENYSWVEIDLAKPEYQGNDIPIPVTGTSLSKVSYTCNKGDATIKINHKHAAALPLSQIKSFRSIGGFDKIFLSSTDTYGKLILLVTTGFISEIKPTLENEVTESRRTVATDVLRVLNSNGSDYLVPSEGKAIEIQGFTMSISQAAPTGVSSEILLHADDNSDTSIPLFRYNPALDGVGDNTNHMFTMSNLAYRGGINKNITLKNMTWTGGTRVKVTAVIYYKEV